MNRAARFFWVCAASAGLLFVALVVISKGSLEPGGLVIFDSRVTGYGLADAQDYLAALGKLPGARESYLGLFRQLDTAFPILLALSLCGAIWLNAIGQGALLIVFPLAYLAADLMENAQVARLLQEGADISADMVRRASLLTISKWLLLAMSMIVALGLWRKARKEQA